MSLDRDYLTEQDVADEMNTGVLPGTKLSVVTDPRDLFVGATNYNLDIRCPIIPAVGSKPLQIRNSIIRGPKTAPTSADGLVRAFGRGHAPVELIDCTIDPQTPSWSWNGLHGYRFRVLRCDISHVVDGIGVFRGASNDPHGRVGVEVRQSYIHDLAYWPNPPDKSHADGSHPDGVQVQGGARLVLRGNTIHGFIAPEFGLNPWGRSEANACLMVTSNVGEVTGLDVQFNRFDGGAASINFGGQFAENVGTVKNNRFGRAQRLGSKYAIIRPAGMVCDFGSGTSANLFDDGGFVTIKNG